MQKEVLYFTFKLPEWDSVDQLFPYQVYILFVTLGIGFLCTFLQATLEDTIKLLREENDSHMHTEVNL